MVSQMAMPHIITSDIRFLKKWDTYRPDSRLHKGSTLYTNKAVSEGCTQEEPTEITSAYDDVASLDINLPKDIKDYGKAVASEIKRTVPIMVEQGADYSNLSDSVDIEKIFYNDWYAAHPKPVRTRSAKLQKKLDMSASEYAIRYRMLTPIQITYINRIIKECKQSSSNKNLLERLIALKRDISTHVPDFEQERLLYVISTLFYGIQAISEMESEGMMLKTPYNYHELSFRRIKTRSENGTNITPDGCRTFLATVWTIAIGEPTPAGEIVASVATVVVAGVLLYEVVTCKNNSLSKDDCTEKYNDCIQYNKEWAKKNSGGMGYSMCSKCLEYCNVHQKWDCPRPL